MGDPVMLERAIVEPPSGSYTASIDFIGAEVAKAMDRCYWRMVAKGYLLNRGWGMAIKDGWCNVARGWLFEAWAVPPGGVVPAGCRVIHRLTTLKGPETRLPRAGK